MHVKTICFYLPQFHPIPENDEWWEPGFTEWNNVVISKPRFKGHYQPHLPADLGFYDLRLKDILIQQTELAKEYGIYGFCFYHYWFNGKLLLNKPVENYLQYSDIDFPFCLCWANESWTRAWDGLDNEVLIEQRYSDYDNENHIEWFIKFFKDQRYIKINNCPLLILFRVDNIPEVSSLVKNWREYVKKKGFKDLYICAMKSGHHKISDREIIENGFDASINFQPNRADFPIKNRSLKTSFYELLREKLPYHLYQSLKIKMDAYKFYEYEDVVRTAIENISDRHKVFPTVFPSWDNSPRRNTPTIIQNNNASLYGCWLEHSIQFVKKFDREERIVFINAWNEWAEGCHLEPDKKNGHMFLRETNKIISATYNVKNKI